MYIYLNVILSDCVGNLFVPYIISLVLRKVHLKSSFLSKMSLN